VQLALTKCVWIPGHEEQTIQGTSGEALLLALDADAFVEHLASATSAAASSSSSSGAAATSSSAAAASSSVTPLPLGNLLLHVSLRGKLITRRPPRAVASAASFAAAAGRVRIVTHPSTARAPRITLVATCGSVPPSAPGGERRVVQRVLRRSGWGWGWG